MPVPPKLPDGYDPSPWAQHTAYSDPGPHSELIDGVGPDLTELSAAARNVIIHYRASGLQLPAETQEDPNTRWISAILDLDQQRHPEPLSVAREPMRRVQGCCRDHSLFATAVLRQHRVPARIRYGFAGYFVAGFGVDHVIVETWDADEHRWRRFDPELEGPTGTNAAPQDMTAGEGEPFQTASEVWRAVRAGRADPDRFGVDPELPERGAWFIQGAVMFDAVFRAGYEFLIWDGWPALSGPGVPTESEVRLADDLSELIVAADAGDVAAEATLLDRVRTDPAVTPPNVVRTLRPWGGPSELTDLSQGPVRVD
jgi:hypothetical protein